MPVDAQVAAVEAIEEPKSLLDVVLRSYKGEGHQNGDIFLVRVVYCGKSHEGTLHPKLHELATDGCAKANAENPFFDQEGGTGLCGFLLDYGDKFVHAVEGYERHVFAFLSELSQWCGKGKLVDDTRILLVDDDVDRRILEGWVYVNKVPLVPSNPAGDMTEDELVTSAARDVENLLELGRLAAESGDRSGTSFTTTARLNYSQLFPKQDVLDEYLKVSALLLTVPEFVDHVCGFPNLVRDLEVNYPAEDPLKY